MVGAYTNVHLLDRMKSITNKGPPVGAGHLLHLEDSAGGIRRFCQNQAVFFRGYLEKSGRFTYQNIGSPIFKALALLLQLDVATK